MQCWIIMLWILDPHGLKVIALWWCLVLSAVLGPMLGCTMLSDQHMQVFHQFMNFRQVSIKQRGAHTIGAHFMKVGHWSRKFLIKALELGRSIVNKTKAIPYLTRSEPFRKKFYTHIDWAKDRIFIASNITCSNIRLINSDLKLSETMGKGCKIRH